MKEHYEYDVKLFFNHDPRAPFLTRLSVLRNKHLVTQLNKKHIDINNIKESNNSNFKFSIANCKTTTRIVKILVAGERKRVL